MVVSAAIVTAIIPAAAGRTAGPAAAQAAAGATISGWLDAGAVHGWRLNLLQPALTLRARGAIPALLVEVRSVDSSVGVFGRLGDGAGRSAELTFPGLTPGAYVILVSALGTGFGLYDIEIAPGAAVISGKPPLFLGFAGEAPWLRAAGRTEWHILPAGAPETPPPNPPPGRWQVAFTAGAAVRLEQTGLPARLSFNSAQLADGLYPAALTVTAGDAFVRRPVQLLIDNHSHFSDVPPSHWARAEVEIGAELSLITGYPGGDFRPDLPVTRAEFTKMLVTAAGLPAARPARPGFGDVQPGQWFYPYAEAARAAGIVTGEPGPAGQILFQPHRAVTRAEAAAMVARLAGPAANMASAQLPFVDAAAIPAWARAAVMAAHRAGLLKGFPDGRFQPAAAVTRAMGAAIMVRVVE